MSSFSLPSPLTIPFKSTRKSTSTFTGVSVDNYMHSRCDAPSSSSSLPSSSPLLTPSRVPSGPRYECTEWKTGGCSDDSDADIFDQQDKVEHTAHLWARHAYPEHPLPYKHQALPSLMTKFAAHARRSDSPLSYSLSPLSSVFQTTYSYPQGGSATEDDCEEYDLESMDIHIRETYFATSAERGRWLSSPIAPRIRSQAITPLRGHSSPIKRLADTSPTRERSHKRARFCFVDEQIFACSSEDCDESMRCSSILPPSSPPMSPISNLSFLGDDCEDDSAVDPHSNSDNSHSHIGTPELSISTASASPVEPVRMPTPSETPIIVHCPYSPLSSPGPVISRHSSHRPSHSPRPTDTHAQAFGTTSFELDDVLSPLSQFELDLVEEEPSKLPLSDTVNKPYVGQHTASPGVTVHVARNQDGLSSIHSLPMNPSHELNLSLDNFSGPCFSKRVKRELTTDNPGKKQTKKRATIRSRDASSAAQKKRGLGNHASNHSEPRSRKTSEVKRLSKLPPRPIVEDAGSESTHSHSRKTVNPTDHAQHLAPAPVPTKAVDVEFHESLAGMLIELLATSRATSMDSSALYSVLTQAHPYLATERSKEELLMAVTTVLEAGRARCGMFDKVDSSGERSRHKALENRWFYVPERDEDRERASLVSAIMPRQKRNETKKYKQYYYRPLDKMSRWDPEDAP